MCKSFIILTLLSVALVAEIKDLYGTWRLVATGNYFSRDKLCAQNTFERNPNNTECKCSKGLKLSEVKQTIETREETEKKTESYIVPLLIVDTPDQANEAADFNCTCGNTVIISGNQINKLKIFCAYIFTFNSNFQIRYP